MSNEGKNSDGWQKGEDLVPPRKEDFNKYSAHAQCHAIYCILTNPPSHLPVTDTRCDL